MPVLPVLYHGRAVSPTPEPAKRAGREEKPALGYGAKIVSSPTMQFNGANHDAICEKLGVDKAYTVVAVLLIGRETETDAVSGASARGTVEEKAVIVK